jgi:hypothetical protein
VSDTPEPTDNGPEVTFSMAALNTQMEQLHGPLPEVEQPHSPEVDISVFRLDAAEAARTDVEKIRDTYQRLTNELDGIDVDLLQPDLLKLSTPKAAAAHHAADVIAQANEYLALAIREGPATEQRSREYAAAVTQAWAGKSAAATTAFEARARGLIGDVAAAQARLDEVAQLRRALEHEQRAGPSAQRALEISNQLIRLGGEEQLLKQGIYLSEHTASSLDFMQLLQGLDETVSETANWMWRDLAHLLLAVEQRRHQRNARYRWMYGAVLAGYAALVVALGVVLDAVLAVTPIAGIVTSLAVAFVLAIVDRRLIAPRLERWNRRENIRLLKDELSACATALAKIRVIQIEIDAMASYTAVPKASLLSPTLLA